MMKKLSHLSLAVTHSEKLMVPPTQNMSVLSPKPLTLKSRDSAGKILTVQVKEVILSQADSKLRGQAHLRNGAIISSGIFLGMIGNLLKVRLVLINGFQNMVLALILFRTLTTRINVMPRLCSQLTLL